MPRTTITGTVTHGINLGGSYGTTLTVAAGGAILPAASMGDPASYTQAGILVRPAISNALITNNGTITGAAQAGTTGHYAAGNGITLFGQGGKVINAGTIMGGGTSYSTTGGAGVLVQAASCAIENAGLIAGGGGNSGGIGVILTGGQDSLTNSGSILGGSLPGAQDHGTAGAGVLLGGGSTLVNHGMIAGGYGSYNGGPSADGAGIDVTGKGGVIDNYGTISGGYSAWNGGAAGTGNGIDATAKVSIINAGTIMGTGGGGDGVTINSGVGVYLNGAGSFLDNTGLISGSNYSYNYSGPGGSYSIDRPSLGLAVKANATIVNSGTIAGPAGGVMLAGAGSTLANSGLITGAFGLDVGDGANASNSGTISSYGSAPTGGTGVFIGRGGALHNSGLIQGGAGSGYFGNMNDRPGVGGTGVYVSVDSALTNTGTIAGGAVTANNPAHGGTGVDVHGGHFNNAGHVIGGNYGDGLTLSGGNVANTGTIAGGGSPGGGTIDAQGANAGLVISSGTAVNAGLIAGGNGGTNDFAGDGAQLNGGTLIDSGVITAGTGGVAPRSAVNFGGAATLEITAGARLTGGITGNNIAGTQLDLLKSANTGILAGLGTTVTGIQTIAEQAGATWLISGASSLSAGSTLSVAGALENQAALTDLGTISLLAGGALTTFGSLNLGTLAFAGAASLIVDNDQAGGNKPAIGTLTGFSAGDTITLTGADITHSSFANGTLEVYDGTSLLGSFNFGTGYTAADFAASGSQIVFVAGEHHT